MTWFCGVGLPDADDECQNGVVHEKVFVTIETIIGRAFTFEVAVCDKCFQKLKTNYKDVTVYT